MSGAVEYPRVLYRPGTELRHAGRDLDTLTVRDDEDRQAAFTKGWREYDNLTDPLDHDGDGRKGGSLKGEQSTRAKGRRKT